MNAEKNTALRDLHHARFIDHMYYICNFFIAHKRTIATVVC